jgi:hypothetical protein
MTDKSRIPNGHDAVHFKRPSHYILEGHTPKPVEDTLDWGRWFESADRVVKQEMIGAHYYVSTVFLGLDHQWSGGPPLLFETMVWADGENVEFQERCSTWNEAEAMHARAVKEFAAKAAARSPRRSWRDPK